MAYTVYMGSFNKRLNSTKQPTYGQWASYDCVFKDETSLYRPTITLSASFSTFSSNNYNYAVLNSRYYWITDVISVRNGVIDVVMSLDALATYKSAITGTSAFVEYGFNTFDASDSSNRVNDNRLPISENPAHHVTQKDITGGIMSTLVGCYVVQAVGNDPYTGGVHNHHGLATFVMSQSTLSAIIKQCNSQIGTAIDAILNNTGLTPQEMATQIMGYSYKQELLSESALAAIQSVKWLPLDISGAQGTNTDVYLGNMATGKTCVMLDQNDCYSSLTTMDIPWPVSDWKRNLCQISLYVPFFGTIPIPVDQCINTSSLGVTWTTEYYSGSVSLLVKGPNVIYAGSTNIAVEMGIGRSQVGMSQLIGGGLQALGGALQMAGGAIDLGAGAIGATLGITKVADSLTNMTGGAQNIYSGIAQTIQPLITCTGSMGGMAAIAQTTLPTVDLLYYAPLDEAGFEAVYGHPVFKVTTPANGFCKTRGFSVSLSSNSAYQAVINTAMDGGVFIE